MPLMMLTCSKEPTQCLLVVAVGGRVGVVYDHPADGRVVRPGDVNVALEVAGECVAKAIHAGAVRPVAFVIDAVAKRPAGIAVTAAAALDRSGGVTLDAASTLPALSPRTPTVPAPVAPPKMA